MKKSRKGINETKKNENNRKEITQGGKVSYKNSSKDEISSSLGNHPIDSLDSASAIKRVGNRVTIKTDGGEITRSNLPSTGINPDNNAFFEERSNPLSSKGSY